MNYQIEMQYYMTQLKNCFLHKDRSRLLESFHSFALLNKPTVIEALSRVDPGESEIFWNFIESVCDYAAEWRDFLCSEFTRLLLAAEKMKDPAAVINSLEAFHILNMADDADLKKDMKGIIKKFLATNNPHLKRFLVWFFANCIKDFDASDISLFKNLRFDEDVIVRYYAFTAYNTLKGYPADKGISPFDKLVIEISDIYACEPGL